MKPRRSRMSAATCAWSYSSHELVVDGFTRKIGVERVGLLRRTVRLGGISRPRARESPAGAGLSEHSPVLPGTLLDEEHLGVLRQRPEVVGHDALEPVGHRAD